MTEFLLVDLVNNLEKLTEDKNEILAKVAAKVQKVDAKKLRLFVIDYGTIKTRSLLNAYLSLNPITHVRQITPPAARIP